MRNDKEMEKLRKEWEQMDKAALTALRHMVRKQGLENTQRWYLMSAIRAVDEGDKERARACMLAFVMLAQMEAWDCTTKPKAMRPERANCKELAAHNNAVRTAKDYWSKDGRG